MGFGEYYNLAAKISLAIIVFVLGSGMTALAGTDNLAWLDEASAVNATEIPVLVFLEHNDLTQAVSRAAALPNMDRAGRIRSVSRRLKSFVPSQGAAIEAYLHRRSYSPVDRFWIVPAFTATLDRATIEELAAMPGVSRVVPDLEIDPIEPVDSRSSGDLSLSSSNYHQLLNVPAVWNMGITGTGRLVCSFDTGVEQPHPALAGKWRGNHAPLSSAWFSTIAPAALPYDKADHGTHTMGIMVGSDGTDTIGIAPGAEWITAGVVDQGKSLPATFSDILGAFQWALDPDGDPATTDDVPDVILNSWGVPASLFSPCDDTFFSAIDNVEAAGVVCIFSAGNEGPDPSSLRNPASRASSPLNSFSVGAVDYNKNIADFSSRGPGGCGFNAVKPEIVAPGVSIRSAAKGGGYKTMSGTSMAAPYIAGLVALCRQYNPNATVEEIKWALINSTEDLGAPGEDNAYGYGLPDAARMLEHIPDPETPHFRLAGHQITGDGVALPGQTFGLQITLSRLGGTLERVIGRLYTDDGSGMTLTNDSADFVFGLVGTTSLGTQPYLVTLDESLVNGQYLALTLVVQGSDGTEYERLDFEIRVGYETVGTMADISDGSLQLTLSDYGQYGLAPGSIYNLGGLGIRYDGSGNLLHEAGLIIGRSPLQLSSSIRGEDGTFVPSDFTPEIPLSDEWVGADLAVHRHARMVDELSEVSIPVSISQVSSDFSSAGEDGIVIMRYRLINTSLTTLNDLYFGFFADFDLSDGADRVAVNDALGLLSQSGGTSPGVGLVTLEGLNSYRVTANVDGKTGFSRADQFALISTGSGIEYTAQGDLMTVVSGGPYTVSPGDSVEVALALIAGHNAFELEERAVLAGELYWAPTGFDDPTVSLPTGYRLDQNYPNPFNPTTTVAFELPTAADVSLQVFNLLGQKVRTLHSGQLPAGEHQVVWEARNDAGESVASGVYFYRLTAGNHSQSRKMVLLR
jgi:subtilisin family serine protease